MVTTSGPITSDHQIDRLAPLWRNLHAHHLAVASYESLVTDAEESWRRRREWYRELLAADACYFLAEDSAVSIGYAFARVLPGPDDTFDAPNGIMELVSLEVEIAFRHRGVGYLLLRAVEAEATHRGIDMLQVSVMAGNDTAAAFYRNAGFSPGEEVLYRKLRGLA